MAHLQALGKWEFRRFVSGTSLLLMNAGFTNGCGMLGLSATLSHMTGVTTRIGTQLAIGNLFQVKIDIWCLISYCTGVFLSALIIGPRGKLKLSWRYSLPFLIEASCLCMVASGGEFLEGLYTAKGLVAFAMGVQNGVSCGWSGGVGRTTHITGFVADISMVMGYMFYSLALADSWRLSMFIPFYFSFMFGAFLGGATFAEWGISALYVPAIFSYVIAAFLLARELYYYYITKSKGHHSFEDEKPTTTGTDTGPAVAVVVGAVTTAAVIGAVTTDSAKEALPSSSNNPQEEPELVEMDGLDPIDDFV
jgi:uncharacterized membrane protein YoaK (UPF0700 family)